MFTTSSPAPGPDAVLGGADSSGAEGASWRGTSPSVARLKADPRYVDPTVDPNDRHQDSLFGWRPDLINYGLVGFGRLTTPDAWLSTWSGLSTNADFVRCADGVQGRAEALTVLDRGRACCVLRRSSTGRRRNHPSAGTSSSWRWRGLGGREQMVAFTERHNERSRAVMRRLGMRYTGEITRPVLIAGLDGLDERAPFALYRMEPEPSASVR